MSDQCPTVECCPGEIFPSDTITYAAAPVTTYWNTELTVACPDGTVGSSVTVPAHTYSSDISQQEADYLAWDYAMQHFTCTLITAT